MSSASLVLQGAITAKIKADNVAGGRIYDRVPQDVVLPYISHGSYQEVTDTYQCIDAREVNVTLHVWSREVGQVEAKTVAEAVRASLHFTSLTVPSEWELDEIQHVSTMAMGDPDGVTTHMVLQFAAIMTPAS